MAGSDAMRRRRGQLDVQGGVARKLCGTAAGGQGSEQGNGEECEAE